MSDYGLTDEGLVLPRAADFLTRIRNEYESRTDLTIDWDADTFLGEISGIVSEELGMLSEIIQDVYDARDPNNATGTQLDSISGLSGVARDPATYSIAEVGLSGTAGTVIPAGSELRDPSSDELWTTNSDALLDGTGSATVEASPPETGPINLSSVPLTWTIVTPVTGWDAAETTTNESPGQNEETDAELRIKREEALAATGGNSLPAIRSNVLDLDFVQQAVVIDNDTSVDQTISGLTLRDKSYAVVTYPGGFAGTRETELANTIYDVAPPGIYLNGDNSITVTGEDGHDKMVRWYYATEVPLDVQVEVNMADGGAIPPSIQAAIEDDVEAYFDQLQLGETVYPLRVTGIVADYEEIGFGAAEIDSDNQPVEVGIAEIGTLNSFTISLFTP